MRPFTSLARAAAVAALFAGAAPLAAPLAALIGTLVATVPASAQGAACGNDAEGFEQWLSGFKGEAAAQGISRSAISRSLDNIIYDHNTIKADRAQGVFRQSFEQFSNRMVPPRVARGAALVQKNQALLGRIERQYGVQGPVLVAIWGLETDFGSFNGKYDTIQSLATLAYDCRRSDKFRAELMDALRIVQRGDLSPGNMHGAWAGEIGQTQFMPSSYLKYAVDYDGKGRADLIRSVPDVLASTAKYLQAYGWQAGQGWEPGQPNFAVIQQWNASAVYSKTIAALATRIDEASR